MEKEKDEEEERETEYGDDDEDEEEEEGRDILSSLPVAELFYLEWIVSVPLPSSCSTPHFALLPLRLARLLQC